MKITYDKKIDAMYIRLKKGRYGHTKKITDDILVDVSKKGQVLGLEILDFFLKFLPAREVFAHCDIPCGIYDPHVSQLAAKTVLTMVKKINELPKEKSLTDENNFIRMVKVKEEHAELCKKEVLILWTDYFNLKHLGKFPDLHDLIWKTTKLCSENKRAVDEVKAQELIKLIDRVANIFNQTKK